MIDEDTAAKVALLRELIDRWTAADARPGGPDFAQCEALTVAIEALAAALPRDARLADPVVAGHFTIKPSA